MIKIKLMHEEHYFSYIENEFTLPLIKKYLKPFINISVKGS